MSTAPVLTNFSVLAKVFDDDPFTITDPSSNSTGAFTYTSSDTDVATISENVITIVGVGSSIITADQATTTDFLSGSITSTFVVSKATPIITGFSVSAKTFLDASFTIIDPSSNSTGLITYSSDDLSVATVDGNIITIVGAGSSIITADQATTTNYVSGTTTSTLVVSQATPTITNFSVPTKTVFDASFTIIDPSSNSTGAFTYSSSNTAVATVTENVVTIVGVGSSIITADQATTTNFTTGTITSTLVVTLILPVLTNFSVPAKTFLDASFTIIDPSSNSTGLITYTSSNTAVATIDGNVVTIIGAGNSIITADQATTTDYATGTITTTLVVNPATTVLTNFSVSAKTFLDASFSITDPSSNSTGLITYTSSNTDVATIDGNVVTIVGGGSSTITATQASTANYTTETITATFVVSQATPTITNFSVAAKTFLDASFSITDPSSNSTGTFTYTSSNTAVATIDGNVITIVGVGSSTITADQLDTTNFTTGTITATFVVSEATPTITNFSVPAKTVGNAPFTITDPSSNSTGALTYTSSNTAVATISGTTVTIIGIGSSTITASQASTTNFSSGTITATFVVSQAPTITNFSVSAKTVGNAPFTITAPTSNSAGAFTYTSSNADVATISGTTVTIVGGGSATITATQASTASYGTGTITATFVVNPATLVLTNFSIPAKTLGDASFSITAPTTNSNGLITYTCTTTTVGYLYVAVGQGTNAIATSIDGITWTGRDINVIFTIGRGAVYINNLWYAFGNGTEHCVATSVDGITWTGRGNGKTLFVYGMHGMVYGKDGSNNDLWVAVGDPLIGSNSIATSVDGFTWTGINYLMYHANNVIYANNLWVAVGGGRGNSIATSTNGTTWTGRGATVFTTDGYGVAYGKDGSGNGLWVAVGQGGNTIATSINGTTWTGRGATVFTYWGYDVAYENNLWVAVGIGGNSIATSVDGTTWTGRGQTVFTQGYSVNYTNGLWFATGQTGNSIATSVDGITWTGRGTATFTTGYGITSNFITTTPGDTSVTTISGNVITINGAGSSTITASQASSASYTSGTIVTTLQVSRATPTITFSIPAKTFGNAPFTITPPISNSTGTFTYTSSNTAVATVSGTTITIVRGGSSTITAVQTDTKDYLSGTITATLLVNPATTVLTNFSVSAKTLGDAPFTITDPSSNSTGAFTYTSSNTSVATVAGKVVTIVGGGSATITAVQASNASYETGTITATFVVNPATPTITNFLVPAKTIGNAPFTITDPSSNSAGAFTYTSTTSVTTGNLYVAVGSGANSIATSADGITWTGRTGLTIFAGQGYCVAYGKDGSNNNLWVAGGYSNNGQKTIATSADGINWTGRSSVMGNGYDIVYGKDNLNNGLWVAVGETGNSIATSTNGTTWIGRGETVFPTGYKLAYGKDGSNNGLWVAVGQSVNSIATSPDGINWTGRGTTVLQSGRCVTYANSLWVAGGYTNVGGNTIATSVDGINWTGRGSTVFSQSVSRVAYGRDNSGNNLWVAVGGGDVNSSATSVDGITWIGRGTTAIGSNLKYTNGLWISMGYPSNSIKTSVDGITWTTRTNVPIQGAGIASNFVTTTSPDTTVTSISGNVITIIGLGSSTITATQASTASYITGTTNAILTVGMAPTITYSIPAKTFGTAPFTINAPTSNSTGAFTYTSSNTAVATVSGTMVTIVGAGSSTITATQANTATYGPGTITATLVVSQATPTITYSIPAKTFGTAPFTINAPTSNSTGAFTYASSNTDVATVSGTTVTIVGTGSSTFTATQASTTNYVSGTITASLVVSKGTPVLTGFTVPTKTFGDASFSLTDPSSNSTGAFTYKTGLYVAVGSGTNSIVSSTDGITWTGRGANLFNNEGSSKVAYGNGLWVALGKGGGNTMATSVDGITWTGRTANGIFTGGLGMDVAYGNSLWVAVGYGTNSIATSTDGITWTGRGSTTFTNAYGVSYGNGLWVVLSYNLSGYAIATSTNGINWTGRGGSVFSQGYCAAYGNGLWVAVGSGNNSIATSVDGINWTGRGTTVLQSGRCVTYANNLWVAVGGGGQFGNSIATSVDGITWTGRGQTVFTNGQSITYGSGLWVATGQTGNSIATSVNGITWTGQTANDGLTIGYGVKYGVGPTIMTISGNVITIVGGGSSIIIAEQAGTTNYTSGTITASFLVNRTTPVLTNFTIPAKTVGDISFSITAPTSNSAGAFTYTSSNTSVATVAGTTVTIIGVGTATITASQATTNDFLAGTITASLVATQGTLVLSNFSIPAKIFGIAPFTITAPTTNSTGAFTYTSDNTAVATVSGTTVTIVGTGSSTITASQATTANYTSATIDASLVVNPATPTITGFSIPIKTVVNDPFTITDPSSNSTGAFTYTSSNTGVATVDGNVITIVAAGSSTITASQASTANYTVGTNTTTLTVNLLTTTLTNFSVPAKTFGDASFNITDPTTNSNGAFTYTSSNTAVATVSGTTVSIVGGGSSTITAVQASTAIYASATITSSLVVSKATTVLTDFSVPAKTFGNAPFSITAPTTNSTGALTYTSSNTAVATVSGTTITIVGGGTSTITANQATTTNFLSGTITASLVVSQATPTITYSIPAKVFGIAPFTITAPSSNSTGAFTYTSDNTAVATIVGTTVTIVGTGSSTITASQASTTNYLTTTITASLVVTQATPTITNFSIPIKTVVNDPFTITDPSSNSTGAFTYTSSNTGVATVDGNVVTIVAAGSSTITASQASTANYISRTITTTLTVNLLTTTLTNFSVPAKTFGDASFNITDPTTNSNGAFTYTSSNTAVATVVGTTITIIGGGSATITAVQASTAIYASGTITASLVVSKATTVLTDFSVPAKTFGNAAFTITAPTTNSNGAFTYTSSLTSVATISGTTITIVGGGTSTITATQATTTNYLAGTITSSLIVSQATPTITGFTVSAKTFGIAPYTITAPSSNSAGAFTYTSSNTAVATVSGTTVTIVGAGSSTITANQASTTNYVSGTITASLVVNQATPTITGFTVPAKTFGTAPFSITAPTTNSTGAFTYASSNLAVATIDGNVVTIIGTGSSTITASQASTTNYIAGTITASFVVNKATTTLTNFTVPATTFGTAPTTITAPTTNSNGVFTYTSSNTAVATVSGTTVTIVGVGSSTITASQATTTNYLAGTITASLVVSKGTPVLTGFSIPVKTDKNTPFTITAPTSTSTGAFTYTSSLTSVATIVGNTITIVGIGTSTITATQATTTNYLAGTITASFVVNPGTPTITNFSVPTKIFLNDPFTITDPSSNSTGAFTYTSSLTSVATIVGNVITIVGGGTSTITASQAGTSNYGPGTITASFLVNPATLSLTNFSVPTKVFLDAPFAITDPTTNSNGLFTYTSSLTSVATIAGNMITIVGGGSSTITATQATTASYTSASITATIQVNRATPTITFSIPTKVIGTAPFTITDPSSNSTGAFTYTSSTATVATVAGNVVSLIKIGTSTITAVQASTTNYISGTITAQLSVILPTPTITFSIPTKTVGTAIFIIPVPTSNSVGAFTYTSSNLAVATILGNKMTIIGAGTSTITVVQAATETYLSGTTTTSLLVILPTPIISGFSIPAKTFGIIPFSISDPASNSTGAFTYLSSLESVATVAGNLVTIVGGGTSNITVNQAGTAGYAPGTMTISLLVNPATPVLTSFSIPSKTIINDPFTITDPSSNSAGAFTYSSSNPSVATVTGNVVAIIGAGSSTITAVQASTTNYISGTITSPLVVTLPLPTITDFSIPAKTFGDASFSLIVPTTNSTGAFTYRSSTTSVATIAGNVITIVGGGSSTITASQASTTDYAAGTITASIIVSQATPTITGFSIPNKIVGNSPFAIIKPTSNSIGAFIYTSSNTDVVTVSGNQITIVGAGSSTITASQADTANYISGSITAPIVVTLLMPTITNFGVPAKMFGNDPFSITDPSSNSEGAFTYSSSNTSVATISGNVITIVGGGTSTITASQFGTEIYSPGTIDVPFVVSKATPVLTSFSVPTKTVIDNSFTITDPSSNSYGAFTYTSSNIGVATVAGNVITIVGIGSSIIIAVQATTTDYIAEAITAPFVVTLPIPTITFSVPAKTFGDASFSITAPTSNSTGAFTYTSSNLTVATVARNTNIITIIGVGNSTITAVQAGTDIYTSVSITALLVVSQETPTITGFSILNKIVVGNAPFMIVKPVTNSTGAFTYTSSNTNVVTISGNMITITGDGSTIITATQASTAKYTSGTISAAPFVVTLPIPKIGKMTIPAKVFGNAPFSITNPTSPSAGAFTYTSSLTSVATVAGNVITIIGGGTSTITARQAGTSLYTYGIITAPLKVSPVKSVPTNFSIPPKIFGNDPFTITAPTSNSDGVFTYTSAKLNVATVAGNVITIVGAGSSVITASQAITPSYLAGKITATIVVSLPAPTITDFSVPNKTFGNAPFSLIAPTTNSAGAFKYLSSVPTVAKVAGNTVTIVGAGSTTISAVQAGTTFYASRTITSPFVVSKGTPTLTTFSIPAKIVGNAPFAIINPKSNSKGTFTYTSSNTSVVTVAGNIISIGGIGSSTITASQASTTDYIDGSITATIVVTLPLPTISKMTIPTKVFGTAPFSIKDLSSNSAGAFTYTSSNPSVTTVAGNVITIIGVGTSTITANQASTNIYASGTTTAPFVVSKATPTITGFSIPPKIVGTAPFTITAPTSNSDGAFTYVSAKLTVATVAGNVVTIVGAGSTVITANQAITTNYVAGKSVATLVVTLS